MKNGLHPQYFEKAKISCACGKVFTTGATQEEIRTDICSNCHPFYTGKEKLIDTAGRIEKFKAQRSAAKDTVISKRDKMAAKRSKKESKLEILEK